MIGLIEKIKQKKGQDHWMLLLMKLDLKFLFVAYYHWISSSNDDAIAMWLSVYRENAGFSGASKRWFKQPNREMEKNSTRETDDYNHHHNDNLFDGNQEK